MDKEKKQPDNNNGDKKTQVVPSGNLKCPKCDKDFEVYEWAGGVRYIECRDCRIRGLFQLEDGKIYKIKKDKFGRKYKNAI